MKKYAAAAIIAALALTGCASISPVAYADRHASAESGAPGYKKVYEAIHESWQGADHPDARWIDTAMALVCKRTIGGIEPRIVPSNTHNNDLVVAVAVDYVCEDSR